MARSRREFKAEAVKLVTEQGYSVAEAARSLGLNDNLIRNWKQALEAQGKPPFFVRNSTWSHTSFDARPVVERVYTHISAGNLSIM